MAHLHHQRRFAYMFINKHNLMFQFSTFVEPARSGLSSNKVMRFPPLPNTNYKNAAAEKHLYFSHSAFIAGGGNVDGSKEGCEKANSVRRKPRTFYDPNWRPIVHQFNWRDCLLIEGRSWNHSQ